jgi:GT2 family glycosyltransferase
VPTEPPTLAVVVVNFGSHALLEENLGPLGRFDPPPTVVVVDNPSTAAERFAVTEQADRHGWTLVSPDSNLGFGEGMNVGVARAMELGAQAFLLLNPDATIDEASTALLLDRVLAEPMTLVAPVVANPDGSIWSAGVDLYLDSGQMRATSRRPADARVVPWLTGACLMVSRRLWTALDGFADGYFLYWEDVDFSLRVVAAGGNLAVETSARAVHAQGGTQDAGHGRGRSATYYYFNTRNRMLFAARHLEAADRRRWARSAVPAAWEILMRGGRRQLLRPGRPVLAVLRGTVAGLRMMRSESPQSR